MIFRASNTRYQKGFSLFEILIVMAFMAVIGSVGLGYYFDYHRQTMLKTTAEEIAAFIYETQQKSIGQQDSSQWGVHFENPTGSDTPFYASFKGSTYSAPVDKKFLDNPLDFLFPADGQSVDIVFNKINGRPSDGEFKKVYVKLAVGAAAKAVKVSPSGVISMDDGEVGWWRFDEGTGTMAIDSSGYGNTGDVTGSVVWVGSGCKVSGSGCLDFSSGGYVDFGTGETIALTGTMTMSAWVNLDSNTATYTVGGRAGSSAALTNYWMDIRSSNTQIYFGGYTSVGGDAYVAGNYTFTPGTWYYVVGVDDGTKLRIYVNGKEIVNGGRADRITGDWSSTAGKRGGMSTYFDGKIDDFRLYDRGLSADEIEEMYERTR